MAKFVTKTASLFFRDREIGALAYEFNFPAARTEEECTTYGSGGWREYQGGLATHDPTVELYQDTPDPEKQAWSSMVNADSAPLGFTFTRPPAQNDLCWFGRAFLRSHADRKPIGKFQGLSLGFKGDAPLVRGKLLEYVDGAGTGNSAALNFGAVASGERLWWAVWVVAFSGSSPTLDLLLQSDDSGGMGSPTTRLTSPQFTSVNNGWHVAFVDGPITDTHWRISRTVGGGGGPTWGYRTAIGLAPVPSS